jgi:hypothetical protein
MHSRLIAMMLAASSGGTGAGGTIWDDDFTTGATIDTAGTRFAGAKPWTISTLSGSTTPTYAVTGGHLVITPQPGFDDAALAYQGTLPAGDWQFQAKVVSTVSDGNFSGAGLLLRESATGKMLLHGIARDFGVKYQIRRLSPSWGASYGGSAATQGVPQWFDVARSGTNLVLRYSTDGSSWTTETTVAQTVDFTTAPDTVGLWTWQRVGGTINEVATFESFTKTA